MRNGSAARRKAEIGLERVPGEGEAGKGRVDVRVAERLRRLREVADDGWVTADFGLGEPSTTGA